MIKEVIQRSHRQIILNRIRSFRQTGMRDPLVNRKNTSVNRKGELGLYRAEEKCSSRAKIFVLNFKN